MSELKGACIIGQSGGPTSVINASAYGVIRTALDSGCITNVYGAEHGIKGVLEDRLFDMSQEDSKELELLKYTPSSALGSCRYKMKDPDEDDTDYKRILEVFKKHDVRYFFYNGGNDSMDTCNKISKYMQKVGYECRVMGVPKKIDNDLYGTDHCPGYASAAKYIATSLMEVYQDAHVYVNVRVLIDLHQARCNVLGGAGVAGAVVGAIKVVVDLLGHAHDTALVADLLHVLADLIAGIHRVISAVVEEIADVVLFEYLKDALVIGVVLVGVLHLVAAGAEGGGGGVL